MLRRISLTVVYAAFFLCHFMSAFAQIPERPAKVGKQRFLVEPKVREEFGTLILKEGQRGFRPHRTVCKDQGSDFGLFMQKLQERIYANWHPDDTLETGKIVTNFTINNRGEVSKLQILKSSGLEEMDEEASDSIRKSAPFSFSLPYKYPWGAPSEVQIQFTFDLAQKVKSLPMTPRKCYLQAWRLTRFGYYDSTFNGQDWMSWARKYRNIGSVEETKVAIKTMMDSLGDPHSHLIDEKEKYKFLNLDSGTIVVSDRLKGLGYAVRLSDETGYLRLNEFSNRSIDECATALCSLEGCKKIILDLRNNRGGTAEPIKRVASMFLSANAPVYQVLGQKNNCQIPVEMDLCIHKGKLVVLVNELTAGSAEILAAALKESGGAVLVGTRTSGKGRVITTNNLPYGLELNLTTGHYLSPRGNEICKGVEPDFVVPLTGEQLRNGLGPWWNYLFESEPVKSAPSLNDIQLAKAIEVLHGKL